ncbi:DUF4870 domain-containing protein [Paenibacillus sp. TRM 82003]|uniref:DUF4870 domain-containing protein n=1 Tax=Kineococcus sp. TRM81007 TaxID=2925831 RepID=UPI001F569F12|nr:DUF4870 domain-containing protein [Kineococcus sp. TRM81007]MCI2240094.1 DUF4870 domain-containing protein [Kineococcus sp. TRM81007]MCI3925600.1 DUF4870 domain-containing protein [Paenibacillus sp. TRM 82003]
MSDPHQPPRPDFTKDPHAPGAGGEQQPGWTPGWRPGWQPEQEAAQQHGQQWPHQQGPGRPPQWQQKPPVSVQDERTWSVLAHVGTLLVWISLPVIAPLVVFLVFKDRSRFVREHAAEALNASISLLIYVLALSAAATVLTVVTLGLAAPLFALPVLLVVGASVFGVLAAVAANSGRAYRYPLTLRLVR